MPLPLDSVSDEDLFLLLEVISKTFARVKVKEVSYTAVNEVKLNSLMESHLPSIVEREVNLNNKIVTIIRGPDSINFDGTRLELNPDFRVIMRDKFHRKFFVTIEAKIVDKTKLAMTNYCHEGIERFVIGNYAWDVSKAIMIAYVRDSSTICKRLTAHLEEGSPPNSDVFAVQEMPTAVEEVDGDVSFTRHNRDFEYIHRQNDIPGSIKLLHIGLS